MRISDWSSDVCSSDLFHLEDAPGIGALALEHAGAVVQPVTEHVQLGVAPGHRLAVVPDDAVTVVEWDYGHRLFRPQNLANFVGCCTEPAGPRRSPSRDDRPGVPDLLSPRTA